VAPQEERLRLDEVGRTLEERNRQGETQVNLRQPEVLAPRQPKGAVLEPVWEENPPPRVPLETQV
jgi:hypothetical protein